MRWIMLTAAMLAIAACQKTSQEVANGASQAESGAVKGVDRGHRGQRAPDAAFLDPGGEKVTLADFEGKPILVNLWASWCAPCVKELPTLARLDSSGGPVRVVAVSQDTGPNASVVAFLDKASAGELEPFHDPRMQLSGALGAQVLPTTVLYDSSGRELWRYVGDLDWTSAEAARLLAEAGESAKP